MLKGVIIFQSVGAFFIASIVSSIKYLDSGSASSSTVSPYGLFDVSKKVCMAFYDSKHNQSLTLATNI